MTEVNINSLFSSLETQANQLNSVAESANNALEAAQNRLVNLNIGIEHWHPIPLDRSDQTGSTEAHDTSIEIRFLLGFAKVDGKWCLAVKKVRHESGFFEGDMGCPYTNEYLETPAVPLLSQSRNLRLTALNMLPEFLEQLSDHVNNLLQELSNTNSKLQSM